MQRRLRKTTAAALLSAVAATLLNAPAALAGASTVRWALPPSADAKQPVSFTWRSHGRRPHDQIVIQRQEGSAHVWRSVVRLSGTHGTDHIGGLGLGVYELRIALIRQGAVRASQARQLAVFGSVPLARLLGNQAKAGVYITSTNTFPYAAVLRADTSDPQTELQILHNRCRSVHLSFVTGNASNAQPTGEVFALTLVQQSLPAVISDEYYDTIANLDAALVPGQPWALNTNEVNGSPDAVDMYINGDASCDSAKAGT